MDIVIGSETFTIDFGEDGLLTVGELVEALSAYDQDTVIARQADTADEAADTADEAADTSGKTEITIGPEADTAEEEADTAEDAEGDSVTSTIDFGDDGELTIGELIDALSAEDQETVIASTGSGSGAFSGFLMPIVGFAGGVILTVIIFLVVILTGKSGKGPLKAMQGGSAGAAGEKADGSSVSSGVITVEKLHDQGARESQQDSFFVSAESAQDNLLAVVADGMGGLSDGDKVSQTAVSTVAQGFYNINDSDPQRLLVTLLQQANRAVNDLLGYNGLYQSGSTMVAGLIRSHAFYYISIGDSRIYLYRGGDLYQLNREHVYRNDLYLKAVNGEGLITEAETHPRAAGLSSFLGMGDLKYIDIPAQPVDIRPGDRFLLMSDGVYNALSEDEIISALKEPAGVASQLLHTAIQTKNYRNQDNYTCVILNC